MIFCVCVCEINFESIKLWKGKLMYKIYSFEITLKNIISFNKTKNSFFPLKALELLKLQKEKNRDIWPLSMIYLITFTVQHSPLF